MSAEAQRRTQHSGRGDEPTDGKLQDAADLDDDPDGDDDDRHPGNHRRHRLAVLGRFGAHQRVAFGEALVELTGHLLRHPVDEAGHQHRRDQHHDDAQAAGDDPLAGFAAPELVPAQRL